MAHSRISRCLTLAALGSMLMSANALAGPLATTIRALNDGFGPDAGRWHGTANIAGAAFGDTVTAAVDWAAFGPGGFQQYLNDQGIAQVDPSGANEVIYVYQIASVTSAVPGIGTLTVGLDATDGRGSVLPPSFVPAGGASERSPVGGGDNTTSMAWFFDGTELEVGDTSSLLVFSSPFAPEFGFLQVNSGLAGAPVSPLVASPGDRRIPEPSSLALAVAFSAVALRRRRTF